MHCRAVNNIESWCTTVSDSILTQQVIAESSPASAQMAIRSYITSLDNQTFTTSISFRFIHFCGWGGGSRSSTWYWTSSYQYTGTTRTVKAKYNHTDAEVSADAFTATITVTTTTATIKGYATSEYPAVFVVIFCP